MFYHVKVQFTSVNEIGATIKEKHEVLVDNCELFAEAEQKVLDEFIYAGTGDVEVTNMKRSNIMEFVNSHQGGDDENIYTATIVSIFVEESGKEKETKYHVGVFAKSVNEATSIVQQYMKMGLQDMRLVSVKETKIEQVL